MKQLLITIAAVVLVGTAFADPIHDVAAKGDVAGVQAELNKGVDVNSRNDWNDSPLHLAVLGGHKEVATLLIDHDANVNMKTGDRESPLHLAIHVENADMALLLINAGAKVNVRGFAGNTPLHIAVQVGNAEIAKLLIDAGAKVNLKNWFQETPMFDAVKSGDPQIVRLLIDAGASVHAQNESGFTALFPAVNYGDLETVKLLIAAGVDINFRVNDLTPLDHAIKSSESEIEALLLQHDAESGAMDSIHVAALLGNVDAVIDHLNDGVDVDALNSYGDSSLIIAASEGNKEVAALLIAKGADVNLRDDWEWTPLHLVRTEEVAELLISNGADVNALDKHGDTPLDNAVDSMRTGIANLLRKHGGKTGDWMDAYNSIHSAAIAGHIDAIKQHIADGEDVNLRDDWEWTPLHEAAYNGRKEVAELLISNGADVDAQDIDGETPLDLAMINNQDELAVFLRSKGAKTKDWLNAYESIHIAAKAGHIDAVKQHISNGVELNEKDDVGRTPLHRAANKEVAELLISNGADVNAQDDGGDTPLHNAKTKELAELLIAKGADVNAQDDGGSTPLHDAAWGGRKEIVELLISNGADMNAKSNSGQTPLHWASNTFFIPEEVAILIVSKLVSKDAAVNVLDKNGNSPLNIAIIFRAPEIENLLREHGGKTGEELKALMPRMVQYNQFSFSFDTTKGKVYEVQDSFDLLNWEVIKTYTGTGDSIRFDEKRDHDPPQWFYRVRVVE